jgi:hypothetical protein
VSKADRTSDAVGAPEIDLGIASLGARLLGRDNLVAEAQGRYVARVG